jgi:hypothetical protein
LRVPDPEAWVFVGERRLIHISADLAEIVGTELDPESGTMTGNVRIRMFEMKADDPGDIHDFDITMSQPTAELTTTSIQFDREINEVRTDDRFVARTQRFVLAGRGLRAIYNELGDRIEHLNIAEREFILIRDHADGANAVRSASAIRAHEKPRGQAAATADALWKEMLYTIGFRLVISNVIRASDPMFGLSSGLGVSR